MPNPSYNILVDVESEKSIESAIKLNYIVTHASWKPIYNARIVDTNQPMVLDYMANIYQQTGENWKNVKLRISTGNPSANNQYTSLATYYLTFNNYYKNHVLYNETQPTSGKISGTITDENGEPLIGANVVFKGTTQGTITDLDGYFEMDPSEVSNILEFSYIGYAAQELPAKQNMEIRMKDGGILLEEVVVTGARRSNRSQINSLFEMEATTKEEKNIPVAVERDLINRNFVIETPYTINSSDKSFKVKIKSYDIAAAYTYRSVPKIDPQAFLIANIEDWEEYYLIDGKVNVYLKGLYKGSSDLKINSEEELLSISIGSDPEVFIERNPVKNKNERKLLGLNRKIRKTWEIKVINKKSHEIEILVEDQYPITKIDEIKVEVLEVSKADINEDTGILQWKLKLKAGEEKNLQISYDVKYPSRRNIIVN